MILSCVIIDDEYLAIKVLEDYVSRNNNLQLVRTFKYPKDALKFLQTSKVDLIFLDIQMPELDGFAVLSNLKEPPMVVFTTARPDYALKAFDLNVLDYLLKPISISRFEKAVEKTIEYAGYISMKELRELSRPDYLMINSNFQVHKVKLKDILFIEGLSEYVRVHCLMGIIYTTLISLKALENKLLGIHLFRVHKSFIVNKIHIKSFTHSEVLLVNGKKIPIGRVYRKKAIEEFIK